MQTPHRKVLAGQLAGPPNHKSQNWDLWVWKYLFFPVDKMAMFNEALKSDWTESQKAFIY